MGYIKETLEDVGAGLRYYAKKDYGTAKKYGGKALGAAKKFLKKGSKKRTKGYGLSKRTSPYVGTTKSVFE